MKSIREAASLVVIYNLIKERSYDILCDIVDCVLFGDGNVKLVLARNGITGTAGVSPNNENGITLSLHGKSHKFSLRDYHVLSVHIYCGRKIDAIKHVRAVTGYGLKESKDLVEYLTDVVTTSTVTPW